MWEELTCDAEVASSGFLSSRILRNLGKRKDIPFFGSTWSIIGQNYLSKQVPRPPDKSA